MLIVKATFYLQTGLDVLIEELQKQQFVKKKKFSLS
jgi:hypothetical protein